MIIYARVTGDPLAFRKTVENTVYELNANLIVFDVTTLELRTQISSFPQRVAGTFVGALGLLALVLAAVGIHAVTAYTTRQAPVKSASVCRWGRPTKTCCVWCLAMD